MKIASERLALIQELQALCIDYWHDVDTNWGRRAPEYYTPEGEFVGPAATYKGREKIAAFYKWREDRGTRTVIHHVANFEATSTGPDTATCHWFLMLYAADGKPELPSKPPIQIAYMTDHMVKHAEDGWQVSYRKFDNWFVGDTPTTNPNLDDK